MDYAQLSMIFSAVVLTVGGIWFSNVYNKLVKSKNSVDEAFATMDVHLEKRYDLIPNLVNIVQASAAHEEETLTAVIEARNKAWEVGSWKGKFQVEEELSTALGNFLAVAESYPELQANKNFVKFQEQLIKIEEDIAHSRKYYNAIVKMYNNNIGQFPAMLYAKMLGYKRRPPFEVSAASKRNNVEVKF